MIISIKFAHPKTGTHQYSTRNCMSKFETAYRKHKRLLRNIKEGAYKFPNSLTIYLSEDYCFWLVTAACDSREKSSGTKNTWALTAE